MSVRRISVAQAREEATDGLARPPSDLAASVALIIERVRIAGDKGVAEVAAQVGVAPTTVTVTRAAMQEALNELDPSIRASLELAAENIREVASAELANDVSIDLPQGQTVEVVSRPVRAAAIYAPGGRAAYPSTVLMGCVPAKVAGVERVVVASPAGADGQASSVMIAAAALGGADEFQAIGGAQAIAALALGTESIEAVDVIAGPGNSYVQEAKRQLFGVVGIDSIAGPSEVVAIADGSADPAVVALDLAAQAEHGFDSPAILIAVDPEMGEQIAAQFELVMVVESGDLTVVGARDMDEALDLSDQIAPEHLELHCADAVNIAKRVGAAGAVFFGSGGSAVFGDYVAGSNHVLPTARAARFSGPLGPAVFQRRQALVSLPAEAARELAPHVEVIAGAEGFPVHVKAARARAEDRS